MTICKEVKKETSHDCEKDLRKEIIAFTALLDNRQLQIVYQFVKNILG